MAKTMRLDGVRLRELARTLGRVGRRVRGCRESLDAPGSPAPRRLSYGGGGAGEL
jgi:hypothetical protein